MRKGCNTGRTNGPRRYLWHSSGTHAEEVKGEKKTMSATVITYEVTVRPNQCRPSHHSKGGHVSFPQLLNSKVTKISGRPVWPDTNPEGPGSPAHLLRHQRNSLPPTSTKGRGGTRSQPDSVSQLRGRQVGNGMGLGMSVAPLCVQHSTLNLCVVLGTLSCQKILLFPRIPQKRCKT